MCKSVEISVVCETFAEFTSTAALLRRFTCLKYVHMCIRNYKFCYESLWQEKALDYFLWEVMQIIM